MSDHPGQPVDDSDRAAAQGAWQWDVVGRVAHGVLHDLNNFLSTITTLSDLLLSEVPPDSTAAEDLSEIKESAWDAAKTSQSLQLFTDRLLKSVDAPSETDIATAVTELDFLLRRLLPSAATVEATVPESVAASVPRATFEAAVLLLAIEARDGLRKGGTFEIRVGDAPGPFVEIRSNGIPSNGSSGMATAAALTTGIGGRMQLEDDGKGARVVRLLLPGA